MSALSGGNVFGVAVVKRAAVAQQQDEVGLGQCVAGTADAFLFDEVVRFAQAGGVEDVHRHPVYQHGFAHDVARGSRLGGDDGAFFADERVQQAGFARVRFAGDDEVDAVVHQPSLPAARQQGVQALAPRLQAGSDVTFLQVVDFFFGEIKCRFDVGAQREQICGKGVGFAREVALQ